MPPGWSLGEGLPISKESTELAESFITIASIYELKADVFPNLDGGCAVAFYAGKDKVEVSIHADACRFDLLVETGIGFDFENVIEPIRNADLHDVNSQLLRLKSIQDREWNLPDFSTYDYLIEIEGDSETSSLETRKDQLTFRQLQMERAVFQYLTPIVHAQ